MIPFADYAGRPADQAAKQILDRLVLAPYQVIGHADAGTRIVVRPRRLGISPKIR